MAAEDVLARPLNAAEKRVRRLGTPTEVGDATFTDNTSTPNADSGSGSPGTSLLAAAADHVHPASSNSGSGPFRMVLWSTTTIAAGARITIATFSRNPNEVFAPGAFVWVRDSVPGVTWESGVNAAGHIATYYQRTANAAELALCGTNASSNARTIDWAAVAMAVM
jgi:hypothetical protein